VNTIKTPLVTGAAGFIGSHLVNKLSGMDEVEKVYCVDLPNSPRFKQLAKLPKVIIVEADLNKSDSVEMLPNDPSLIFALAALNGTSRFYTNPWMVLKGSFLPTLNIIEKYKEHSPILYSSSSEVYASTVEHHNGTIPTPENISPSINDVHNPRWSYAGAKLFGEIALNAAAVEYGTKGAIVRYHNVYGPNMGLDHFVPDFISRARKNVREISGGNNTRSFLHVSDAIEGTIAAARNANSSVPIYHLGTSDEMTIEQAARKILEIMDQSSDDLKITNAPEGSVARRCPDIAKAAKELGWHPRVSFVDGINNYLHENNFDIN
jgi:nucleoside-diphosphate-sugar epimerase